MPLSLTEGRTSSRQETSSFVAYQHRRFDETPVESEASGRAVVPAAFCAGPSRLLIKMNSENAEGTYKLRDHPAFPNEIAVSFRKELRPELICAACNCITAAGLKDKKGHVFCQTCAHTLTDDTGQFTCYLCDTSAQLRSLKRNDKEWQVLENMQSACPNENKGCDFSGKLRQVLMHYEKCDMRGKVRCTLCGDAYAMKVIAEHMENDCPQRLLECVFCERDVEACQKRKHEANCDQRPGTCEYCAKKFKTYKELEQNHEPVCQLKPIDCSFKQLGCDFKAARREMERHEENSRSNGHSELFLRKICHLERENQDLTKASKELLTTVTRNHEEKMREMERKMVELQQSANAEKTLRTELENEVLKLKKEVQALTVKEDAQYGQLSLQISETENAVQRLTREVHLDHVKPGFVHIWKLQPYHDLKTAAMTSAETISSGTLYINTPGYHVEFTVGFGSGSTASPPHLSFKCQICPGQYDDMLPWPFKNKIIVVLVNQLEEQARRSFEMDAASAEHAMECLKKPESGQRNPKFGVSQIISVPLLENVKKGFLSQNCVVFKIIVPSI
ncbi:hypothetical protein MRX96_040194 [Rhipicephalus microplus]